MSRHSEPALPVGRQTDRLVLGSNAAQRIPKQVQHDISFFAFIFSKKLDKKAVRRNKVKRRLNEAVRQLLPKIKTGLAIVFLPKKEIMELDYQEILKKTEQSFKKAGLLEKKK